MHFYLLPSIRIPPVDELIEQKSPCVQTPTAKKKKAEEIKRKLVKKPFNFHLSNILRFGIPLSNQTFKSCLLKRSNSTIFEEQLSNQAVRDDVRELV